MRGVFILTAFFTLELFALPLTYKLECTEGDNEVYTTKTFYVGKNSVSISVFQSEHPDSKAFTTYEIAKRVGQEHAESIFFTRDTRRRHEEAGSESGTLLLPEKSRLVILSGDEKRAVSITHSLVGYVPAWDNEDDTTGLYSESQVHAKCFLR